MAVVPVLAGCVVPGSCGGAWRQLLVKCITVCGWCCFTGEGTCGCRLKPSTTTARVLPVVPACLSGTCNERPPGWCCASSCRGPSRETCQLANLGSTSQEDPLWLAGWPVGSHVPHESPPLEPRAEHPRHAKKHCGNSDLQIPVLRCHAHAPDHSQHTRATPEQLPVTPEHTQQSPELAPGSTTPLPNLFPGAAARPGAGSCVLPLTGGNMANEGLDDPMAPQHAGTCSVIPA